MAGNLGGPPAKRARADAEEEQEGYPARIQRMVVSAQEVFRQRHVVPLKIDNWQPIGVPGMAEFEALASAINYDVPAYKFGLRLPLVLMSNGFTGHRDGPQGNITGLIYDGMSVPDDMAVCLSLACKEQFATHLLHGPDCITVVRQVDEDENHVFGDVKVPKATSNSTMEAVVQAASTHLYVWGYKADQRSGSALASQFKKAITAVRKELNDLDDSAYVEVKTFFHLAANIKDNPGAVALVDEYSAGNTAPAVSSVTSSVIGVLGHSLTLTEKLEASSVSSRPNTAALSMKLKKHLPISLKHAHAGVESIREKAISDLIKEDQVVFETTIMGNNSFSSVNLSTRVYINNDKKPIFMKKKGQGGQPIVEDNARRFEYADGDAFNRFIMSMTSADPPTPSNASSASAASVQVEAIPAEHASGIVF